MSRARAGVVSFRLITFGVVLQNDELAALSTVIVAPTSRDSSPSFFRPEIEVDGQRTRVLVEQLAALDLSRVGALVGSLSRRNSRKSTERWLLPSAWTRYTDV